MADKRKSLFISGICAAVAVASFALPVSVPPLMASAREDARAAVARGLAAINRGDPRTARVELMNAIKADPNLAEARSVQARALLMLGDGRGAQGELERAQALGEKPGPLRHLLAHSALLQGRYEDALIQVRADDANPAEALFLARMEGQALQALGRYDEAAKAFDRALKLAPEDGVVWADIARFNLRTGNMGAAISATDKAQALSPKSADILVLRALIVREQYGPDAARRWFDDALAINPDYIPALIEYAATLADLSRGSQALVLTRRVLALAPGHERAYAIQAILAARAGNYELARTLLGRTNGILDGWASIMQLRGVLHLQARNAALAVKQFRPLLEMQPLNIRARLLLARALYEDGQYADAERTLFPLVERADASHYALTLATRINEALGNRDAADGLLQRASLLSAGPSDAYLGAGTVGQRAADAGASPAQARPNLLYIRALMSAGRDDVALTRAKGLAAANPGAPAAIMVLGDAQMAAGKYRDAALTYEKAANIRFREDIALRLVDAWRRAGDEGTARRALGLFVAQNPMNIEGQRLLAAFALAGQEYDRALSLLSGLRDRLGNEDVLLMADISRAYVGLDQPEKALPFAAHAYRLEPMSAVASDIFGWTLLNAGWDKKQAITLLEKAHGLRPAEALVQYHLGQAYVADGAKDKARPLLKAAADAPAFPHREEAQAALKSL